MNIIFKSVKPSSSDIPIRRTDLWSTKEDGTTVVFSDANYHLEKSDLNPVGTYIWKLCDGSQRIEDIAHIIQMSFQFSATEEQEVLKDCIEFAQTLQDRGLIYIENSNDL